MLYDNQILSGDPILFTTNKNLHMQYYILLIFVFGLKIYFSIEDPIEDLITKDDVDYLGARFSRYRRERPGLSQLVKRWFQQRKNR